MKDKIRSANDYFRIAAKTKNNNIDALINKAEILCKLGNIDEGLDCIEKAIKINPNDVNLIKKRNELKSQFLKIEEITS